MSLNKSTEVVVIGSGPGGYTAAFRAADLGKKVTLIERHATLGGVCLNVGCIPSKALLHAARVLTEAEDMANYGLEFTERRIDSKKLLIWKNGIVQRLTAGLKMLAQQRGVEVVNGMAEFSSPQHILVSGEGEQQQIAFEHAIIAAGSRPVELAMLPQDPRIINSTGALQLAATGGKMLVIGGGIIGLEMATVYAALGCEITIVELMPQIIPGCDLDVVQPLYKRLQKICQAIHLENKVTKVVADAQGLQVTYDGPQGIRQESFDQILCAVGRRPNSDLLALDKAGVTVNEHGFIPVDTQQRTNVAHIYAIGDIVGMPMLAHKATPEGRVAAEVIAGYKHYFAPCCIPNVAYTDPEIAWVGLSETAAKSQGIAYEKGVFPWAASGRSLCINRSEGLTKILVDPTTHRVLGGAIVGPNAGELIAELALAIEMGCDVADLELTVHPHPTLAETIALAAEVVTGTITDLYIPKKASS
jgi:dihydrolipoamide dehydrogenase